MAIDQCSHRTEESLKNMVSNDFKTEQENFWAGNFGNEYSERNIGRGWIAANTALFAKVLGRTKNVRSVVEFGANIGLNLRAMDQLIPEPEFAAVEINCSAAEELRKWGKAEVFESSILNFLPSKNSQKTLRLRWGATQFLRCCRGNEPSILSFGSRPRRGLIWT